MSLGIINFIGVTPDILAYNLRQQGESCYDCALLFNLFCCNVDVITEKEVGYVQNRRLCCTL